MSFLHISPSCRCLNFIILYCCEIFLGLSSHLSSPSLLAFVLCLEQWAFHLPLSFAIMPLCLLFSCSPCPFIPFTVCMHTLLRLCLPWLTPCLPSVCRSPFWPCSLPFTHSSAISLFYRMSQVQAWTLGPSVTCGKSFQKKLKENVLLYSPLTGKSLTLTNSSWCIQSAFILSWVYYSTFWLTGVANYCVQRLLVWLFVFPYTCQHGRVWGTVRPSCHHGERTVQVSGLPAAH